MTCQQCAGERRYSNRLEVALREARQERDLAIAHDRQPYPTADAYELACKARDSWQKRAEDAESRLAASPGARHDVPDLEAIARRVEGLRELAQRQGTWGIEYGDDRFCAAVLAMLRPPVLVPRDEPTREDIEG